jgi:hypothetical protein
MAILLRRSQQIGQPFERTFEATCTRHTISQVTEYQKMLMEEVRALEEARRSGVVNHTYTRAFWICATLIAAGAALFVFYQGVPVTRGIACGPV